MKSNYTFAAEVWLLSTEDPWHLVTLPQEIGEKISTNKFLKRNGFGSIRVNVTLGNSHWETSLFPFREKKTFNLPIKSEIRKEEKIRLGDKVKIKLFF